MGRIEIFKSSTKIVVMCMVLLEYCGGVSVEEDLSLTQWEKAALDKFKTRMLPHLPHAWMKHDIYMIRWLRASGLNQDRAEQMLRDNINWRQHNKMDTIDSEDWSDMEDDFPYDADTFDKQGRPIGTVNIAPWNFRRVALTGKMPRLLRYMDKLLEEATQSVVKQQSEGKNVTQWKVILNMDGFNMLQHGCALCLPAYVRFLQSYEQHYPGYADAIVLIRTPPAFQIILEVVRPFFSPSTQRALRIFGMDDRQWKDYLDKEIAKEERRPEFGGTKLD